jgi:hypothetical protein
MEQGGRWAVLDCYFGFLQASITPSRSQIPTDAAL